MNLVVRNRYGFADAFVGWPGFSFEASAQHGKSDTGGLSTSRLTADPVDDHVQPAMNVNMEQILVAVSLKTRIGVAGGPQIGCNAHSLPTPAPSE
jgi:hypothetical protein